MLKEAYEAGVRQAMIDAGLLKEAFDPNAPMDPGVRRGIRERRFQAIEEGNQYAKGYNKNVPMAPYVAGRAQMRNTAGGAGVKAAPVAGKPAAPAATASAPAAPKKPFDYGSAIGASSKSYVDKVNKSGPPRG